jgi:hypothetical protein
MQLNKALDLRLVWLALEFLALESFSHEGMNKVYLQNFLGIGVTSRDESNDSN